MEQKQKEKIEQAKNIFADVQKENFFVLKGGKQIRNIFELSLALGKMNNEIFNHHVTSNKNDFESWIKDVIKDEELAESMSKAKTPEESVIAIKQRIRAIRTISRQNEENQFQKKEQVQTAETKAVQSDGAELKSKQVNDAPKINEVHHTIHHHAIPHPHQAHHTIHHEHIRMGMKDYVLGLVVGLALGIFIGLVA